MLAEGPRGKIQQGVPVLFVKLLLAVGKPGASSRSAVQPTRSHGVDVGSFGM